MIHSLFNSLIPAGTRLRLPLLALLLCHSAAAAPWQATIPDPTAATQDRVKAVRVLANGDTISAAQLDGGGGDSSVVVTRHLAADGSAVWTQTVDNTGQPDDVHDIVVDPTTGDTYLAASTDTAANGRNWNVVGLSGTDGSQLWQTSVNGDGAQFDEPRAIALTPDGDVVVGGATNDFGATIAKFAAADGSSQWARVYASGENIACLDLAVAASGNVVWVGRRGLAAGIGSLNGSDGVELWIAGHGGLGGTFEAVSLFPNGDAAAAGYVNSSGLGTRFSVMRYAGTDGVQTWNQLLHENAAAYDVEVDCESNVVAVGMRDDGAGLQVAHITRRNGTNGSALWSEDFTAPAGIAPAATNSLFAVKTIGRRVLAAGTSPLVGMGSDHADVRFLDLNLGDGTVEEDAFINGSSLGGGAETEDTLLAAGLLDVNSLAIALGGTAEQTAGDAGGFVVNRNYISTVSPIIEVQFPTGTPLVNGSASIAFPDTELGSSSGLQTVTIRNACEVTLTISGFTQGGSNLSDFTLDGTAVDPTLSPGETTTFTLNFTPSAVGGRSSTISISSSDQLASPFTIALTGNGTAPPVAPEIVVDLPGQPDVASGVGTLPFPTTGSGITSAGQTVTIRNSGNGPLSVTGVSVTGTNAGDFAVVPDPFTSSIAPSGQASFNVTFTPGADGTRSAVLAIASNDIDENPFTVNLTGTGASLPTVVTSAASPVGAAAATLNGTANPNGLATSAGFEYSIDPTLLSGVVSTPSQTIGSGTSAVSISAPLTGLLPLTTYYYRAVGSNSAGNSEGSILSFATLEADAVVSSGTSIPSTDSGSGLAVVYRPFYGVIGPDGSIACQAFAAKDGVTADADNDFVLMSNLSGNLALLGREGDPVTGGGTRNAESDDMVISAAGTLVFREKLDGATTTTDDVYMESLDGLSVELFSREGDAAPGSGGTLKTHYTKPAVSGDGTIYLHGSLSGEPVQRDSSVMTAPSGGTLSEVIREGDAATTESGDDAWYGALSKNVVASNSGPIFHARLQNNPDDSSQRTDVNRNQILMSENGGVFTELARRNDDVTDVTDGKLDTFFGVSTSPTAGQSYISLLRKTGVVVFSNDQIMMARKSDGTSSLVAREGTVMLTGGLAGESFSSFRKHFVCEDDSVVFEGFLDGVSAAQDQVVCRWTENDGITLIAREGVTDAPGVPGAKFGIIQHTAVSPAGKVMVQAILDTGGYGVFRDLGSGLELLIRTGTTVISGGVSKTALGILTYRTTATSFNSTGGFGLPINDEGAVYLVLSFGSQDYEGRIYPPN